MNWRILICLSVIFISSKTQMFGQKQANNWIFGDFEVNFNSGSPSVSRNPNQRLNRGFGSISDANGSLLFYSDGFDVWNQNHQLMPNGMDIFDGSSSPSIQESIVVPKPGSNTQYYLFTTNPWNGQQSAGLYYSIIDMSLNGGLGDVIEKGTKLIDRTDNKMSAISHANGQDFWLLVHEHDTNKYHLLEITQNGISTNILEIEIGHVFNGFDGQLKFAPDGKKVGVSYNYPDSEVAVFDFNTSTGQIQNPTIYSFEEIDSSPILRGLAFSSDATKLYVNESRSDKLYQFDLNEESTNGILSPPYRIEQNFIRNSLTQMQLGPDGKIYITKGGGGGGTEHLGVIANPNAYWEDIKVTENGLYVNGGSTFVARTPNFIQDQFYKTSFLVQGSCQSSQIQFNLTNDYLVAHQEWSFGDGNTSEQKNPIHQYEEPGNYQVQMTVYSGNASETISQQVNILPYTSVSLGEDRAVCSGEKISVADNYSSYFWSTGDTTNFIRVYEEGNYALTVTNENGCSFTDNIYLTINELPEIDFPDSIQIQENPIELKAGEFHTYEWNTGETSASVTISEPGWYSLLVSNTAGCQAYKSVFVYKELADPTADGDWERLNPAPTVLTGKDIYLINELIGFVLNDEQLLKTNDGGISWNEVAPIEGGNRIEFHNSIGYVVGNNGNIYRSTHFGEGWNLLPFESDDNLNAISIIDDNTLFVSSDDKVFMSDDAGQTWTSYEVPNIDIEDSFFQSAEIGHVAGKIGIIMKTKDGGETWTVTQNTGTFPSDFFKISFINEDVGFATQEHSDLYMTTDAGETWKELNGFPDAGFDMAFIDEKTGFIVGDHGAIHKINLSTLNWEWAGFNGRRLGQNLYGVSFIDQNIGFATGQFGRIIKTTNGGKTWTPFAISYEEIRQIHIVSKNVAFALERNTLFKTDNHGKSWFQVGSPSVKDLTYRIDFLNEQVGYAIGEGVGAGSSVYKTTDGGLTWNTAHETRELIGETLYSMDFITEDIGFVSGGFNQGLILKTIDGGESWDEVGNTSLFEMQFVNETTGFGRTYREIFKTIDSGQNWEKILELDEDITAIDFVNDTTGYLVGDEALMYKTTDGGMSWTELEIPFDWYLDVEFYSNNVGYILDEEQRLYKTLNGGENWELMTSEYWVQSISLFEREIYIAGEGGNILRSQVKDSDLVDIQPLSVVKKRMNTATLNSIVQSNLDTTTLYFEYGQVPDVFDVSEIEDQFSGITSKSLTLNMTNLQDSTWYYVRLRAVDEKHNIISDTIKFRTKGYTELINLGDISLIEAPNYTATIEASIFSELETTPLHFEIGTETGNYDQSILVETFNSDINTQVQHTITDLKPLTTYFCRFKIIDGNRITNGPEFSFTTDLVANIDDPKKRKAVSIYPNPSSEIIQIQGANFNDRTEYQIVDLQGKEIQNGLLFNSQIDVSSLLSGTYILNIMADKKIFTTRFFKK